MAKKAKTPKNTVTLTDDEGKDHVFNLLDVFKVKTLHFAVLQPTKGKTNRALILKLTLDKKGRPEAFEAPSEKEFKAAVGALEERCACECECGCHEDATCCEEAAAPKARKAAKKPAARKAPASKKKAPRKSAARR